MKIDSLFSEKQKEFLFSEDKRLNFLTGSVRSGKTYISLLKFALMIVAPAPKNATFLICAKTLTTLKRNCLNTLQTLVGKNNFTYSISKKEGVLFGHIVYLEGASDETSEGKIRGMTLAGAYCDEVTLFPESFFTMLLSRLSVSGAKLYATCNPDSPNHWVKTNYIDNIDALDCVIWKFLLTDNKFLDKEYIKNISKEYTGVFYNRFILGEWVRAEGIIYTLFANNTDNFLIKDEEDQNIIKVNIGVDFGGSKSATSFVCTGFTKGFRRVVILESERHEEEMTPDSLSEAFTKFADMCIKRYKKPIDVYADTSEQILIRGLRTESARKGLRLTVHNAKKMAILERILLVNKMIGRGMFNVKRHCVSVIRALQDAVWNEDKENERLDDFTTDIDTLDALEYSIEPFYNDLSRL